jgi:predicted RNase H-like nuclease (RuvC/YqgF family)
MRLVLRWYGRWKDAVAAVRHGRVRTHTGETIEKMRRTIVQSSDLASAALAAKQEAERRLASVPPSRHAVVTHSATQASDNADMQRLRAQVADLHHKAKYSSEIMAAAKAQLHTLTSELRLTKARETELTSKVRELSATLESEAAQTRRLKEDFVHLLASHPSDGAGNGAAHTHVVRR